MSIPGNNQIARPSRIGHSTVRAIVRNTPPPDGELVSKMELQVNRTQQWESRCPVSSQKGVATARTVVGIAPPCLGNTYVVGGCFNGGDKPPLLDSQKGMTTGRKVVGSHCLV